MVDVSQVNLQSGLLLHFGVQLNLSYVQSKAKNCPVSVLWSYLPKNALLHLLQACQVSLNSETHRKATQFVMDSPYGRTCVNIHFGTGGWINWKEIIYKNYSWFYSLMLSVSESGFGGLEVACWPLVLKFAGSNPAEAVGKNPQHAFLRRGSKSVGPMS